MDDRIKNYLVELAVKYETPDFLCNDPSRFMHAVAGKKNQEVTAFVASGLSYGSRKQFLPKIENLLHVSEGDLYSWIRNGKFHEAISDTDDCFYRLYSMHTMRVFFCALKEMLDEYGSIGEFVAGSSDDGLSAVRSITEFFSSRHANGVIPINATSSCKRICMFLRWMVRDSSPVDLGLWSGLIDKRSLIMPMDTHVIQEASNLHLLKFTKSATITTARRLTAAMAEVFPDDPLKGDFALFGLGVDKDGSQSPFSFAPHIR